MKKLTNGAFFFRHFIITMLIVFSFCIRLPALAQNTTGFPDTDEIDGISLGELLNIKYIETATKHLMEARKAPAFSSVITEKEI